MANAASAKSCTFSRPPDRMYCLHTCHCDSLSGTGERTPSRESIAFGAEGKANAGDSHACTSSPEEWSDTSSASEAAPTVCGRSYNNENAEGAV
jgi:hypothetical protein